MNVDPGENIAEVISLDELRERRHVEPAGQVVPLYESGELPVNVHAINARAQAKLDLRLSAQQHGRTEREELEERGRRLGFYVVSPDLVKRYSFATRLIRRIISVKD